LSDLLDRLHEREMTIAQVEDAIRAKYPPPVPDPIEYVYSVEWEAMPEPAGATQAVGVAEGVEDGSP
jgi:hypothetical protein